MCPLLDSLSSKKNLNVGSTKKCYQLNKKKSYHMTLKNTNRWAAAGAIAGASLIIYSPLTYWFMDTLAMGKGYIAANKGTCPSLWGLMLHTIVLFFAVYGLLTINWACD